MPKVSTLQISLLDWYDRHRRVMPWRAGKGRRPNPYHVWLSEIMLQQTTVAAVGPYFEKFTSKWPAVGKLAAAPLDDVLTAWAGLGYYARARNLHKCAKAVAKLGAFPETVDELLELPGIGPYTAAAISSIAFDRPAVAVDGNVERVVSRFFAITEPLPQSKSLLREKAAELAEGNQRPGDFTQAFMELGATVCTPRSPKCGLCPWQKGCKARAEGIAAGLPRKSPKKAKPVRYGKLFWIRDKDGRFLIHKRQDGGLYGGMYQLPTSDWTENKAAAGGLPEPFRKLPRISALNVSISHSFTHFDLVLEIWGGTASRKPELEQSLWISPQDVEKYALPSLMKKAIRLCAAKGRAMSA